MFIHYNAKLHCIISDLPFTCNCSLLVKKRRLQPFSAASISSSGVMGVSLYLRQILSHSSHEWQSYVIQKGIDSNVSKLKEQRKIKFKSVLDEIQTSVIASNEFISIRQWLDSYNNEYTPPSSNQSLSVSKLYVCKSTKKLTSLNILQVLPSL